eukprot:1606365-Prorocentrum_lima.AAC.1
MPGVTCVFLATFVAQAAAHLALSAVVPVVIWPLDHLASPQWPTRNVAFISLMCAADSTPFGDAEENRSL